MKRIIIQISKLACVFSVVYLLATSCEEMFGDFLDKPPGVDVTEDTIFSSQINAEKFLMGIYSDGMYCDLRTGSPRKDQKSDMMACFCDEGENAGWWLDSHKFQTASISPTFVPDDRVPPHRWIVRWTAVRSVNILLNRIDDVPDADDTYKDQAKGQALFIRGLCYFENFKNYGGVPIVDKRFDLSDPDNLKVPRATLEDVVDFIVADAEEAARLLPDSWSSIDRGRASKGAALMLKSRTLLYAASPLSNTASPPLSLPGDDNLMICYGNYDADRWKLAAEAAKAVIDWAPGAGIHILTGDPEKCYQNLWEAYDNNEVIMTSNLSGQSGIYGAFSSMNPFYYEASGTCITMNFIEKYEKKDGTPMEWAFAGSGGRRLNQIYADLDPRFRQSVAYNGSYFTEDFPELRMYEGAPEPNQQKLNVTGHYLRKFYPSSFTRTAPKVPFWYLYRLGEAYLNYAEAMNEAYGPYDPGPFGMTAYDAVKVIRDRVEMPMTGWSGLSMDQFRDKIQNERAIELAYEEHRLWDVLRWRIAEREGVMQGDFRGLRIYRDEESPGDFRYETYVFEKRYWKTAMYRRCFRQEWMNKGYLVQNPGW